ncbi:MAG: microcompartment protein CcmK/EutM [Planctomycetota bacterium]|jgi:microcompartment protein CcmK/EutM
MFLADVIGTVVSPEQISELDGHKLLLLRQVLPNGDLTGKTRIGIDQAGAGIGDRVIVLDEGNGGRQILRDPQAAARTIIVGIVDYIEKNDNLVYDHRNTPGPVPLPSKRS